MSLDSRLQAAEEAGSGFSDAELAGLAQSLPEGSARARGRARRWSRATSR